jgi:TPR repeat protein
MNGLMLAICALAIGVALSAATHNAAAERTDPTPLRAQAHAAFELRDYGRALTLYLAAADAGDLNAAERAGEMMMGREPVYGREVPLDPERASILLRRAACAGSASAAELLDELRLLLAQMGGGHG